MPHVDHSGGFAPDLLRGQVAYIAGGTRGINLGIATTFARHGADVALVGRDTARGQAAASAIRESTGRRVLSFAADVRDDDRIARTLSDTRDELGPVDMVVSGAAGNFWASAVNLSPKGFRTVVDIDLIGTYNVFRAAFDVVADAGASMLAITAPQAVRAVPFQVHAAAAKAGINQMVRCLALEWGPARIRVNGLSPGAIAGTEGGGARLRAPGTPEVDPSTLLLGRMGELSDTDNAALYLASSLSSFVTGTILEVEGGATLGAPDSQTLVRLPRSAF